MNFCPNCGAKNEDPSATFCANCGFKFAEPEKQQATAPAGSQNRVDTSERKQSDLFSEESRRVVTRPENNRSGVTRSESTRADLSRPEITRAEVVRPEVAKPSTARSEIRTFASSTSSEEPSRVSRLASGESSTAPAKKNISAFDDDVTSGEDLFILPKATSANIRPRSDIQERIQASTRPDSLFDEDKSEKSSAPSGEDAKSIDDSSSASLFDEADTEVAVEISSKVEEIQRKISQLDLFEEETDETLENSEIPKETDTSTEAVAATSSRRQAVRPRDRERVQDNRAEHPAQPRQTSPAATNIFEMDSTPEPSQEYTDSSVAEPDKKSSKKANKKASRSTSDGSGNEKPRSTFGIGATIVSLVLVIAVLFAGIFAFDYFNKPDKTIDAFVSAVQTKDIATLKKITRLDNIPTATDANWLAFCEGFAQEDNITVLRSQLTDQITNPKNVNNSFPAVRLVTKSTLGIFKTYQVAITGVSLTVPNGENGIVLKLNDISYTGTLQDVTRSDGSTSEALVFSNIMPGYYSSCQLVGSNGSATESRTISFYTNNDWGSGPLPDGSSSSGTTTPEIPDNSTAPDDVTALTGDQVNTLLDSFYRSYLNAMNNQSTSGLANATSAMEAEVEIRMQKPGNQTNIFTYESAVCTPSTIQSNTSTSPYTMTFTATFKYGYTPRDGGDSGTGENVQKVELVYQDGEWLVNSMQSN